MAGSASQTSNKIRERKKNQESSQEHSLLSHFFQVDQTLLSTSDPIFAAVINGRLNEVQAYIQTKKDLNILIGKEQWSLLELAILYRHEEILTLLLNHWQQVPHFDIFKAIIKKDIKTVEEYIRSGGDCSVTMPNGRSLHDFALLRSQINILSALVYADSRMAEAPKSCVYQFYADISQKHNQGRPLVGIIATGGPLLDFISAAVDDDFEMIFIHLVVRKCDVNMKAAAKERERTALMVASFNGNLGLVKFLLKHKASLDSVDNRNWQAIHYAIYGNQTEVVRYLIETAGVSVNTMLSCKDPNPNEKVFQNLSLLSFLIIYLDSRGFMSGGKLDLINTLIDLKIDVNQVTTEFEGESEGIPKSALLIACENNEAPIVMRLLEVSASVHVDPLGKPPVFGKGCLAMAAGHGNVDVLRALLNAEQRQFSQLEITQQNSRNQDRFQAVCMAVSSSCPAAVDSLLTAEYSLYNAESRLRLAMAALAYIIPQTPQLQRQVKTDLKAGIAALLKNYFMLLREIYVGESGSINFLSDQLIALLVDTFVGLDFNFVVKNQDGGQLRKLSGKVLILPQEYWFSIPNIYKKNPSKTPSSLTFQAISVILILIDIYKTLQVDLVLPLQDLTVETMAELLYYHSPQVKKEKEKEIEAGLQKLANFFDDTSSEWVDPDTLLEDIKSHAEKLKSYFVSLESSLEQEKSKVKNLKQQSKSATLQKRELGDRQLGNHGVLISSKKAEVETALKMANLFHAQAKGVQQKYTQSCEGQVSAIQEFLLDVKIQKAEALYVSMRQQVDQYNKTVQLLSKQRDDLSGIETQLQGLSVEMSENSYSRFLESEQKRQADLQLRNEAEREAEHARILEQQKATAVETERQAEAKRTRLLAFRLKQQAYEARKAEKLRQALEKKAQETATGKALPAFSNPMLYQAPKPGNLGEITQMQENMDVLHELGLLENILNKPKNKKLEGILVYHHVYRRAMLGLFARVMEFIKELKGSTEPVPAEIALNLRVYLFKGKRLVPLNENDIKQCAEFNQNIKEMVLKLIAYYRAEKATPSHLNITVQTLKEKIGCPLFSDILDEAENLGPKHSRSVQSYEAYTQEISSAEKELTEASEQLGDKVDAEILGWAMGFTVARLGSTAAQMRDNHAVEYRHDRDKSKYKHYIRLGNQFRHEPRLAAELLYQGRSKPAVP